MLASARQGAVVLFGAVVLATSLHAYQDDHAEDTCVHLIGYGGGPTQKLASRTLLGTGSGPGAGGMEAAGICAVDNARTNRATPIKTTADFIPVLGDDSLGFYCVYGVKASATGGVGGNVCIYLFELDGGEVLMFGSGYGNIQGANLFDAAYDMERVDQILRFCMGRDPATTPIRIVAPHGHGDHINPACNRELERLGYRIVEIAFAQADFSLVNGMAWTAADRGLFRILPTSTTCLQELTSYSSPLGKIWFFDRPGHTPGSIDLVLDVLGDVGNRIVVRGSQPSAPCTPVSGQREILLAHGNAELLSIPPTLADVSPLVGTSLGGTSLTLTGTNFAVSGAGTHRVYVNGVLATAVAVNGDTSLTCKAPPGPPGQLVDVAVVNNNGKALYSGSYFYNPLPTLTSVTPANGDWRGGTLLQVRGSGFLLSSGVNEVYIGGTRATAVQVKGDTLLTCRTPVGTPGTTVPVLVRNPNGDTLLAVSYRYDAALAVLGTTPPSASALGGTLVTLNGSSFTGNGSDPVVTFGGVPSTDVTLVSDTVVTAVAPPGAPGALVDVVLTNSAGSATLAGFRYNDTPHIASLLPSSGRSTGGSLVTLTGGGFLVDDAGTNQVRFGGIPATQVNVLADDSLQCLAPPGDPNTQVNVTVSNQNGTATLPLAFTYRQPLTLVSLVPESGTSLGGAPVTILGSGFVDGPAGPTTVTFGGLPATGVSVLDDSTLTCFAPGGTPLGQVDVELTNANGVVTLPLGFRYHGVPTLATVSPGHGHAGSFTPVVITGTGFLNDDAGFGLVVVGGITASDVLVTSDTSLTCMVPPGTPGSVADVLLVNQNGQATKAAAFRYHALPTLASISPTSGAASARPRATLTGTGFLNDDAGLPTVLFGGQPAALVSVLTDGTLRCDVPAGTPGQTVDVVVTNNRGSTTLAGGYRFHALPALTGLSPARGTFQGGTAVTIAGSGFLVDGAGPNSVTFGGVPATAIVTLNDTSLTCKAPPSVLGAIVDVVVSNANGSTTLTQGFSYSVAPPAVATLTPSSGPADAPGTVLVSGSGFLADAAGPNTVLFGGVASPLVSVVDDATLSCEVPAGLPGTRVDVSVTNANGTGQRSLAFRYHARPTLSTLVPNEASSLGGATLQVTGTGFLTDSPGTNAVTFAGTPALDVLVLSDTQLQVVAPPGLPGTSVEVQVGNANGQTGNVSFSYHPLPGLLDISPTFGPLLGGTQVTLRGSGFVANNAGANAVRIGNKPAQNVVVLSDTQLTCVTARGTSGFADVRLSNDNGSVVLPGAFHYGKPPPAILSVEPASGPGAGQNVVTLRGHGFQDLSAGPNRIKFGAHESTSVITVDDETILCQVPSGNPGAIVDVAVNNKSGTFTLPQSYRYHARPTLTSISPGRGEMLKSTRVTLTGSGFVVDSPGTTTVRVGGVAARSVQVLNDTTLTCLVSGGGPGAVLDVTVRNDNGSATLADAFAVDGGPPSIVMLTPNEGPFTGGTTVEMTGEGFTGLTRLEFGGVPVLAVDVRDDRHLSCVTPPGVARTRVNVLLRTKLGEARVVDGFGYTPVLPKLLASTPDHGPAGGGTRVSLTGSGFLAEGAGATRVFFGQNEATGLVLLDDTHASCDAPPSAPGQLLAIRLENKNGSALLLDAFRTHALPTLTALAPSAGLAEGGTSVELTGSGFLVDGAGPNAVLFGTAPAQNVAVLSDTRLTCRTPAGTSGASVDVRLTNLNGEAVLAGAFRFRTRPVLTSLAPARGLAAGGTELTLTGSAFLAEGAGTNRVTIGGAAALAITTVSDTTITCTTPPGTPGAADIVVTNDNGTSVLVGAFEFFAPPTLAGIAPARGPADGGTQVTLTGTDFLSPGAGANLVLFGGIAALDVIELDDSTLTCTTPPGTAGSTVDVTLANANGSTTLAGAFQYHGRPILSAVAPDHGPSSGAPVTLTGSGFLNDGAGTNSVTFGGIAATSVVVVGDSNLTCVAPAGTPGASVDVALANANGQSLLPGAFRYGVPPTLTALSPSRAPLAGGIQVTLTGAGFENDSPGVNQVLFGGVPAADVASAGDGTLTCTAPASAAAGAVDVTVTNANGTTTLGGAFEYFLEPALASLTPAHGPAAGGAQVTLLGQGFLASGAGANLVLFGGIAALDVIELDDATLTCTAPPGVPGTTVDVTLANANGVSSLPAAFRYHALPTLATVAPADGPARGRAVTLTGQGFLNDEPGANQVSFGGVPATLVAVVDDTTLTCRAPAGTQGTVVDVALTNANGTSLLAGAFRYHLTPTLSAVSPARGPLVGGTLVTLTGTGFLNDGAGSLSVTFGFLGAVNVTVIDDTKATCTTPGGASNALVDVGVSNTNGDALLVNAFRYNARPALTTLAPTSGSELGGTLVTLGGSGFSANEAGPCTVQFGTSAATDVQVLDDSTLTCVAPAGIARTLVDVRVTNANGTDVKLGAWRHDPVPRLTALAPQRGPAQGGLLVTLTGSGFADPASGPALVTFGGLAATDVVVLDDTQIQCTVPAGPGGSTVDVLVANAVGQAVLPGAFRYHAVPTLSAVLPPRGSSVVSSSVTLQGSGFLNDDAGAPTVLFGSVPATNVLVADDGTLTCDVAPQTSGSTVDVRLSNQNGSALLAAAFAFESPTPTLASISPGSGVSTGGTSVTLSGSGFLDFSAGANTVTFGGAPATAVVVVDDATLQCVTPAGTPGATVDVALSNANGSALLAAAWSWVAPKPVLTTLAPSSGPDVGGGTVLLTGSGFQANGAGACTVAFGGQLATGVSVLDDTQLTCTVPAGLGGSSVDVTLSNANGSALLAAGYRYHAQPAITSISPIDGTSLGGTLVTVRGSGFSNDGAGINLVRFDGLPASSVVVFDDTRLTCRAPSGASGATVTLSLSNQNGSAALPSAFRYHAKPTLTSVTSSSGKAAGGDRVTLNGTGFLADGAVVNIVSFGGITATSVSVISNTTLQCNVPAGTSGLAVQVTIANVNGTAILPNGYRYHSLPSIASVSPSSGPTDGGTAVVVTGSGFQADSAGPNSVTFGGVPASGVSVIDDTQLSCLTPPGAADTTVDVVVSNANGSGTLFGAFTYEAVPIPLVTLAMPSKGSTLGSTSVTLVGSGFQPGVTVRFGGVPAQDVVVIDSGTLTCRTPASALSLWVDVQVEGPGGGTSLPLAYWYVAPPVVTSVEPPVASPRGGAMVIVHGSGFLDGEPGSNLVTFAGLPAPSVTVLDDQHLSCEVPSGPALTDADVEVLNDNGTSLLSRGFRWQMQLATDLDSDGRGDLILSSPGDATAGTGAGAVRVFFGAPLPLADRGSDEADAVAVPSALSTDFGVPVASGDLDGDGNAELVVAAPGNDERALNAGSVYVFRGPVVGSGSPLDPTQASVELFSPTQGDRFGSSLLLRDFDRDGWLDLLVGSTGRTGSVQLFLGGAGGIATEPALVLGNAFANEGFGTVLAAGDLDGDGWNDFVIGAPNAAAPGSIRPGVVRLFHGGPDTLGAVDPQPWLVFTGQEDGEGFGRSLAVADVSGDGIDDLIIGSPASSTAGATSGVVRVFFGRSDLAGGDASAADVELGPEAAGDRFGRTLATGDVDGDGRADLLIGAPLHGGAGRAYLFLGASGLPALAADADVQFDGEIGSLGEFGSTVACIDVDGDGLDEVVVTAPELDSSSSDLGRVYVFDAPQTPLCPSEDANGKVTGSGVGERLGRYLGKDY